MMQDSIDKRHINGQKRMLLPVLLLVVVVFCISCSGKSKYEEYLMNYDSDTARWQIETLSNSMVIDRTANSIAITSLNYVDSDKEWIQSPVDFDLPQTYKRDKKIEYYDWKYVGAQTQGDGGKSIAFAFKDDETQTIYKIHCSAAQQVGLFEFSAELVNAGDESIRVYTKNFFTAGITGDDVLTAWSFPKEGGYADIAGVIQREVKGNVLIDAATSTFQDHNQSGSIPILYLDDGGRQGAIIALEWPTGRVQAKAGTQENQAILSGSLGASFNTIVPANQTLNIPIVYFGVYQGDVDEGSNYFKRWFFDNKAPETLRNNPEEPFTQMDMQLGLDVEGMGVQSIKWDYGWWSNEQDTTFEWTRTLEGSWQVRSQAYLNVLESYGCKTLADFGQMAKERDLNFTIYLLLHDAKADIEGALTSVGSNGHPEWFSNRKITAGASADLGNQECVDFLKEALYKFFGENNIGTWRTDFEPICSSSDKQNRHDAGGEDVEYWCAVGFYELVDYLLENIEGFRYENCSSGGSLKDYATMRRASVVNNDDSANYNSLRTTFYDTSYCIHPTQIQLPCNPDTFCDESTYYDAPGDKDYGMRSIIIGVPMFGSWTGPSGGQLPFGLNEYYVKYLNMYNDRIKPLQRSGDLYHILPRPDGVAWDGVQYVGEIDGATQSCVFLFKPTNTQGEIKKIVLRGLNPDQEYDIVFEDRKEQSTVMKGSDLMDPEIGIEVSIEGEFGSEILWISTAQAS